MLLLYVELDLYLTYDYKLTPWQSGCSDGSKDLGTRPMTPITGPVATVALCTLWFFLVLVYSLSSFFTICLHLYVFKF